MTLLAWWVREMAATSSPFSERMTLFWHNHFTKSFRKVRSPLLLYRQNVTPRRYALDNFRNRRGRPNENFARELLELVTLGEGRYAERDIKEAARAFTGWAVDRDTGAFRFVRFWHDAGFKTFMGRRGRFNGDGIIEIVLRQQAVATHITKKAWRAFVSETPDAREVAAVAARFRHSGYDIKTLMRGLLLSRAFWAPQNGGRLIKSPVDLIVGTVRQFGIAPPGGVILFRIMRTLGQIPFMPPNVKGWSGGKRWINANTLLARRQVLRLLLNPVAARAVEMRSSRRKDQSMRMMRGRMPTLDIGRWVRGGPAAYRDPAAITAMLLAVPPVAPPGRNADPARFVRILLLDPAYQLK